MGINGITKFKKHMKGQYSHWLAQKILNIFILEDRMVKSLFGKKIKLWIKIWSSPGKNPPGPKLPPLVGKSRWPTSRLTFTFQILSSVDFDFKICQHEK